MQPLSLHVPFKLFSQRVVAREFDLAMCQHVHEVEALRCRVSAGSALQVKRFAQVIACG